MSALALRMLDQKAWAIVGSHGRNPICDRLHATLLRGNKRLFRVNPGKPEMLPNGGGEVLDSLESVGEPVDVVNLVINPGKGVLVVDEMRRLGIKHLWIQPGAESQELCDLAERHGIAVYKGCVLIDAKF